MEFNSKVTQQAIEGDADTSAACIMDKSLNGWAMTVPCSLTFLAGAYGLKKYDQGRYLVLN